MPAVNSADGYSQLSAVDRALQIVEALFEHPNGLTVTEIGGLLKVNKGMAYRLVGSLVGRDYATMDEASGRYSLTFRFAALGSRLLESTSLSQMYLPLLRRLAAETTELARLGVVEGDCVTWVAEVQGAVGQLRVSSGPTVVAPLHATASGKAMLMTLSDKRASEMAMSKGLDAFTEGTITEIGPLLADLACARERGYAIVDEEFETGICGIAVPVVTNNPEAVATVSVAIPKPRMAVDVDATYARPLQKVAADIGFQWTTAPLQVADAHRAPSGGVT